MKFWVNKEFKALEKDWYRKLKEQGFVDIEKQIGSRQVLWSKSKVKEDIYERSEYYRQLQNKIHTAKFDSDFDRTVMTLTAQGYMIKDIVKVLAAQGDSGYRGTVRYRIRKYENLWGVRKWTRTTRS